MELRHGLGGLSRIGAGLALFGVTTYVFLLVGARTMGVTGYANFAVYWGLIYGIGIGICLPFEQEVSRRVALARATGGSASGTMVRARMLGMTACLVLAVAGLPLVPLSRLDGGLELWLLVTVSVAALMAAYISRGALSGELRWAAYSSQLVAEGLLRVMAAGALGLALVRSPWWWALAVPAGLVAGLVATGARRATAPPREPRQPIRHAMSRTDVTELASSLGTMMVATVVGQSLVNLGPAVVRLLDTSPDQGEAGRFLATMLLARGPIFAFAAVQPVLIPALATAVARGDDVEFRRRLLIAVRWTAGLGSSGVLVCLVAGPELLGLLGPGYELSRTEVTLCGLSMALYLATLVLQPAAIASGEHRRATHSWLVAAVVFLVLCLLPLPPVLAVEVALVAACLTAVALLWLTVRRGLPATRRAARAG